LHASPDTKIIRAIRLWAAGRVIKHVVTGAWFAADFV